MQKIDFDLFLIFIIVTVILGFVTASALTGGIGLPIFVSLPVGFIFWGYVLYYVLLKED